MRFRNILSLTLAALVLSACHESATSPTSEIVANDNASIMTASTDETVPCCLSTLKFGVAKFDTLSFGDGLEFFGTTSSNMDVSRVLDGSEKVGLYFQGRFTWLWPDKKTGASYHVLSDWQAVEPEKHPGISYNGLTEFIFQVTTWRDSSDGYFYPIKTQIMSLFRQGGKTNAKLNLPPLETGVYSVSSYQRFMLGCVGDDSIKFTSTVGTIVTTTEGGYNYVYPAQKIPSGMISCSVYSSEEMANAALRRKHGEALR